MNKKDRWLFFVLIVLFFLVKFLGPVFFVNSGLAQLLIKTPSLSGIPSSQFYMGESEIYFGMLTQLLSGLAFAFFCMRFLKTSSTKAFAGAVFVYFFLTNCEVLFFPPYGDPISGPWVEAVWLARHHFDFHGLLAQPGYMVGGPKVYVFTIYPAFLAFLMKMIPNVKLFLFFNHLLTFAMSAVIVAIVRQIANQYLSRDIAILTVLISAALPLFQSMTEGINMEIPYVFFIMLMVWVVARRKFALGALYAILAVLSKGTGMIACLTIFMVGIMDWRMGEHSARERLRNMLWGCLGLGFAVMLVLSKYLIHDQHTVRDMGFLRGWDAVVNGPNFKLFAVSALIGAAVFLVRARGRNFAVALKEAWAKYYAAFVMFITVFNWMVLFVNFAGHSPRYDIALCGPLVFCLVFVFGRLIRTAKGLSIVTWLALAGTLLSSYGVFHQPKHPKDTSYYEYLILERSLEYRNDMKMYMEVTRELERNFSDFTIGAPFIMAHALAIPELGYVRKHLNTMSYATTIEFEGVRPFEGLENLDIRKTVWVGFKGQLNPVVAQVVKDFPVDPKKDLVLKQVGSGDRYATLFMGGYAIDQYQNVILYMLQHGALKSAR